MNEKLLSNRSMVESFSTAKPSLIVRLDRWCHSLLNFPNAMEFRCFLYKVMRGTCCYRNCVRNACLWYLLCRWYDEAYRTRKSSVLCRPRASQWVLVVCTLPLTKADVLSRMKNKIMCDFSQFYSANSLFHTLGDSICVLAAKNGSVVLSNPSRLMHQPPNIGDCVWVAFHQPGFWLELGGIDWGEGRRLWSNAILILTAVSYGHVIGVRLCD